MANKTVKKPAPKPKAKAKAKAKARPKAKAKPKDRLECRVCGYRVIVDESSSAAASRWSRSNGAAASRLPCLRAPGGVR
jgi:hypothetical protein